MEWEEYNPILIVFVQKLFQFRLTLKIAQREKYRASEIENKKSLLATFLMNYCVRKISHHDFIYTHGEISRS